MLRERERVEQSSNGAVVQSWVPRLQKYISKRRLIDYFLRQKLYEWVETKL